MAVANCTDGKYWKKLQTLEEEKMQKCVAVRIDGSLQSTDEV
jgi:hypothetical protein